MGRRAPGDLLRRFVLDYLVEQALKESPLVDGRSRKLLNASFSVEPLAELGNARKYRIIAAQKNENRRVYLFLFSRPSRDRFFATTEQCFRRTLDVLRLGHPGVAPRGRRLLVREALVRQRTYEKVGLLLTEIRTPGLDLPRILEGPMVADIPKTLLDLGVVEVYKDRAPQTEATRPGVGHQAPGAMERTAGSGPGPVVSVEQWLDRAYTDTFGKPPVHVALHDPSGPVYVVRVLGVTREHEEWALEVTRHLRVREGSIRLEVRLLDVT